MNSKRFNLIKRIIEEGNFNKDDLTFKIVSYQNYNYLTEEEAKNLLNLISVE